MDIKDFTYLLLAMLANNSKTINVHAKNIRAFSIPGSYKEVIEKIMSQNNGWAEKFSVLIDTEEYFENNYKWEDKFSRCLRDILKEMGKETKYDVVYDNIDIVFTQDEINKILERYTNKKINEEMEHFSSLLVDYSFTRRYKAMQKELEQIQEKNKNIKPINKLR